ESERALRRFIADAIRPALAPAWRWSRRENVWLKMQVIGSPDYLYEVDENGDPVVPQSMPSFLEQQRWLAEIPLAPMVIGAEAVYLSVPDSLRDARRRCVDGVLTALDAHGRRPEIDSIGPGAGK